MHHTNWTQKSGGVKDILYEVLTDKAPKISKISTLEAFLLYMAKQGYPPDDFQHACVHLKYALRGAAMMHCRANVSAARTSKWCQKWLSSSDDHCVAWTWLQEEKKWAAFYKR
jgi:hypothetical protein